MGDKEKFCAQEPHKALFGIKQEKQSDSVTLKQGLPYSKCWGERLPSQRLEVGHFLLLKQQASGL